MQYLHDITEYISHAVTLAGGVKELAAIAKVSERTVYAWKRGERFPSRASLRKVGDYLHQLQTITISPANKSFQSLETCSTGVLSNSGLYETHETPVNYTQRVQISSMIEEPSAKEYVQKHKVKEMNFCPSVCESNDFFRVPFYTASSSNESQHKYADIAFNAQFLQKLALPKESVTSFVITTDNMAPTLNVGDTILIHCYNAQLIDGALYLLAKGKDFFVRRIFITLDGLALRNDNPQFSFQDTIVPNELSSTDTLNLGRVVWAGKRM